MNEKQCSIYSALFSEIFFLLFFSNVLLLKCNHRILLNNFLSEFFSNEKTNVVFLLSLNRLLIFVGLPCWAGLVKQKTIAR